MRALYIVLIIVLQPLFVFSQGGNHIFNGEFREFHEKPVMQGHFDDYVKNWSSRMKISEDGFKLHSPDYIWDEPTFFRHATGLNQFIKPTEGKGMVGVYDYEVFQQRLRVRPLPENIYYLSFDFFNSFFGNNSNILTSSSENSVIDIYLSDKELEYVDEDGGRFLCTTSYKSS